MKLCDQSIFNLFESFIARYALIVLIATVLMFFGVTILAFESVTNGIGTTPTTINSTD